MKHLCIIEKFLRVSLTLTLLLSVVGSAMAEENRAVPNRNASTVAKPQGPTDPAELEAFLDGLFAKDMQEHHIAGAAVAVVKDGKLFFTKGYGYANLEKNIPVDPEQTGFITGSVGKLFTWTAVMQLVEQGKLDLNTDINTYLDFRIPATYPQPITLKNLLTHTDGFEERFFEYLVLDAKDSAPVREWLVSHMPARVRPPSEAAAYSNYGTSLAGYIVARVSGRTYDQYLEEHIFKPLGMVHSTAKSPFPPELLASASVPYTYQDGEFKKFPSFWPQSATAPAGTQLTTITDMARFMIAHLQNGRYNDAKIAGVRILKESTARQMHSQLFTHDPRLLGTAHGFFEFNDNGQRTLGHSGEASAFNTLLLLLPERNLGVYVAYNSQGGEKLTLQHLGFQRAFFDHYFPAPAVAPIQPPTDFAKRASRFAGSYKTTRSSYTTQEKVKNLMGGVEISDSGDGALLLNTPWFKRRFVEVEPLYFRQVDGPFGIVFKEDSKGRITQMFTDFTPMMAFEKLPWYETLRFNMAWVASCVLLFLSVIPVALIRFIRSRRNGSRQTTPRAARIAYWVMVAISVLNLMFVVGTALWGNLFPVFGVSAAYKTVLGLGVLSAALTLGALVYTVLAWAKGYWGIAARVHYTLVSAAAVAFVWFLSNWNLLGWRF